MTEGFPWHSSVPCSVSAPLSRGEGVCPGSRLLGARAAGQNLAHPVPARAGTAEAARRQKGDQNPLNLQQTTNSRQVGKFRTRLAFFFLINLSLVCLEKKKIPLCISCVAVFGVSVLAMACAVSALTVALSGMTHC